MRDFAAYLLYRAAVAVVTAMPLPMVFRLGAFAGSIGWAILPNYRRLALRNVTIAFGRTKSASELRALVYQHFCRLGANLLSSIKSGSMAPEELERRVEFQNIGPMAEKLRQRIPVVLLLSHLSNWELFSQLMPRCFPSTQPGSVYQPLSNRWVDAHVRKIRSRTGLQLFDRSEGFKPVIDFLRAKGGLGVLSDQHAGDNGLWAPLFGRLASTSPLPELLAKRSGSALFAAAVYTEGVARWKMVFTDEMVSAGESIEKLTARANAVLERQINVAPADWFWVHDRWKTPRPNFLLRKYKRGVYLPPEMTEDQLTPFRILIRSSNWLGDAVMSVPAVRAIKRGRPDAHVTVLTSPDLASVWKLVPEVDKVVPANTGSLLSVVAAIRRQPKFDAAVLFPNSLRTAMEVWLGGIPRRVGFRGHHRSWLLNQLVRERGKPRPPEHQSKRYLRIAQELGADASDASLGAPVLPPESEIDTASGTAPIMLGLCPGAEYGPAKRWLPERFAEAAAAVARDHSVRWALFGKNADRELGNTIASSLGEYCINRIGQTTVEQLIRELRTCRLVLTNDTGTMHLAALLGVPTVSIFGSTEPALTGPLGQNHIVLRHHVECSPCFLRKCPIDFRCMKAITADEVVAAVLAILGSDHSRNGHNAKSGRPD